MKTSSRPECPGQDDKINDFLGSPFYALLYSGILNFISIGL